MIGEEIRRLLKKHKKTRDQLLALVVGVPAIANVEEGVVLSISTMENWRSVPLRALLAKQVGCLVVIERADGLRVLGAELLPAERDRSLLLRSAFSWSPRYQ